MLSEVDICELFPAMTLEDKSSSSGKLKLKNKKKKKKKEDALKKLCGGGVKKKAKKKAIEKKKEDVNKPNENKKRKRQLLGVRKLGTLFSAEIIHPDGRRVRIGTYMTLRDAAMAYDKESLNIYGLQKPFNFPRRVIIGTPEPSVHGR